MAERILLRRRRVPLQLCKLDASVKGKGWQAAEPDPGCLKQEMDLLNGIYMVDRAAGDAWDAAPEKGLNEVELGFQKLSRYHEHQPHEGTATTSAELGCCSLSCWHRCHCSTWQWCITAANSTSRMDSSLSLLLCATGSTFKVSSDFINLTSLGSGAMLFS